jgi:hypothetical protein
MAFAILRAIRKLRGSCPGCGTYPWEVAAVEVGPDEPYSECPECGSPHEIRIRLPPVHCPTCGQEFPHRDYDDDDERIDQ